MDQDNGEFRHKNSTATVSFGNNISNTVLFQCKSGNIVIRTLIDDFVKNISKVCGTCIRTPSRSKIIITCIAAGRFFSALRRRYRKNLCQLPAPRFCGPADPGDEIYFYPGDGLDAVGSVMKRWHAGLEPIYILRKARFIPPSDLSFCARRYLSNQLRRLMSRQRRLAFWGPRLEAMQALLAARPLEEVWALQWKACVDAAAQFFARQPSGRWIEVAYETLVREPADTLQRILELIGMDPALADRPGTVDNIFPASVGKGRQALGQAAGHA